MASIIAKEEYLTGPQRTAAFFDLPILGFDYLQERFYLVGQLIQGAQKERSKESLEKVIAIYRKAEELRDRKEKAKAFSVLDEAYKLGTAVWNPERP